MAPIASILAGAALLAPTLAVRLLATHFSGQIYTLDLSLQSATKGSLAVTSNITACGVTPTWLTLDEKTRTLYCFDESWQGSGVITQWSLPSLKSSAGPKLTGSAPTPGNSVFGSTYGGSDGRGFVATVEYTPSTLTTYKLPITSASKPIQTLEFTQAKPGPRPDRQEKPHPHAVFTDPTGEFLVVPDLGADLIRIFKINKSTGELTAGTPAVSLPGDGPRHGVFRKVGSSYKYYSLNEVSSSVGVYDVTYPTRHSASTFLTMTLKQTLSNYGPSVPLGNVNVKSAEIRIVGDFLYASNRNDTTFGKEQDSIAIFKIDSKGALKFQELTNSYGYYPRSFSFNKAGTYAAIAGQTTANVAIVKRDTKTGSLGPLVANLVLPPRGTYGGEDGMSSIVWDE